MLHSRSIHRQQNVNKNIDTKKEPFFSKQSDVDKPHQPNTFFQAKFSVNKPGDKYEQEADAVANKVVNKTASSSAIVQQKEISSIQRLSTSKEEEPSTNDARMALDKEIQEKPIQRDSEAEEGKEKMGSIQRCSCGNEEAVQKMEEEVEEKIAVQTKADGKTSVASDAVSSKINDTKGNGSKLSKSVNHEMSSSIGADFSNVNIHTNGTAISMNKELHAQAFTHGNDIYFNEGKFNPSTREGKFLLAHELTHVVQQGAVGEMTTQKKEESIQMQSAPVAPAIPGLGTTTCGKPSHCPATFCEPFFSTMLAEQARNASATALLAGIAAKVSPRVVPLWSSYLFGGASPSNISTDFGADFTTSATTADTTTFLVDSLRAELTSHPPVFPTGQSLMVIDIPTTIPAAVAEIGTNGATHQMNFNKIGEIPGNIAGGIGNTQTACPVGARPGSFNDSRTATGQAVLIKNGNTITVIPTIIYQVNDTIDLCPGDCGASIEQAATILLSKFEATGISGDVPFTVDFPSMPIVPFDITLPAPAPTPTPAVPTVGVVHASSLNIRRRPNLSGQIIGSYRNAEIVNINCRVSGQSIDGNNTWYQTDRGFISARYVNISGDAPTNC
jgi:hypothetical protein